VPDLGRRKFLASIPLLTILGNVSSQSTQSALEREDDGSNQDTHVAAIYFPSWHDEPRRSATLGPGWTEWELIRNGRPRFEGHYQPIVPEWGFADETDPANLKRSCDAAATAGIDAFLWDWYWYDEQDFLNRPLNETYLSLDAPAVQFALMWANHDWVDVFPARGGAPGDTIWDGEVDRRQFRDVAEIIIERYFTSPHYWKPDGRNWFTIYQLDTLEAGLGGYDQTREALTEFRELSAVSGTGDIHFNTMGGYHAHSPEDLARLGIDSVGEYTWGGRLPLDRGLEIDYAAWRIDASRQWKANDERFRPDIGYIPNLTMGWDSTPRVNQDEELEISTWPFLPVVTGNSPDEFGKAAEDILHFLDTRDAPRIMTINAWNEWTEGSYLEPDNRYGMRYLDALKRLLKR
jgi:hypothetical protein